MNLYIIIKQAFSSWKKHTQFCLEWKKKNSIVELTALAEAQQCHLDYLNQQSLDLIETIRQRQEELEETNQKIKDAKGYRA